MSDEQDRRLVDRTLAGDRQAFGELVKQYQIAVYTVAFNVLRNTNDAEDAAQSAFLKAYEQLGTFNHEFKFFSWLYRIAVNESINARKKKRPITGLDGPEPVSSEKADALIQENELEDQVDSALMDLSPEDRAIILLRHYQDFSYPDIAYIMDTTEGKIKSRLFTARQRLRGIFEKRGITARA
ncbi:MAG: sigma-70 family RNA polymerase sigma factor [Bacteroidetes bacterium]|nr:sigma-70 family RNA polymerase sigma factor [Bacteroidota bacterium]